MNEIYNGVRFYGHGNILKKYAHFPLNVPLPVSVQHGWMRQAIEHDAPRDAAENWYWSEEITKQYNDRFPYVKSRTIGAPFLYCLKSFGEELYSETKHGSIVFPFHSTENVMFSSWDIEYCNLLKLLPEKYHPITVCIYHADKKMGRDAIFKKNGFAVVCNGNDPCQSDFLYNFIKNVAGKKYFFTNHISTSAHYAAMLGVVVYLHGPEFYVIKSTDHNIDTDKANRELKEIFKQGNRYYQFPHCDREQQYEIARKELGADFILSKMKMMLLLYRLAVSPKFLLKLLDLLIKKRRNIA